MYAGPPSRRGPGVARVCTALILLTPLFLATPSGAQGQGAVLELTDPPGDVRPAVFFGAPQPVPSSTLSDAHDIIGLKATETVTQLQLEIRFANLEGSRGLYPATMERHRLEFESSTGPKYDLWWFSSGGEAGFTTPSGAMFCLKMTARCSNDPRPVYDVKNDLLRIDLSKELLAGRDADGRTFAEDAAKVTAGGPVQLRNWYYVIRHEGLLGAPSLVDELQAPTPMLLQLGIPNQELVLVRPTQSKPEGPDLIGAPFRSGAERSAVSVASGDRTPVVLVVENKATAKRLVNLTASFEKEADANDFRLRMPPAIEVPAGQSRNLTVVVETATGAAHRQTARVLFEARALGQDAVGARLLTLQASEPLRPQQSVVFLHAGSQPAPNGRPCTLIDACSREFLWMNGVEKDAAANLDARVELDPWPAAIANGQLIAFNVVTETPLARGVHFEPGKPVLVKLAFSARQEFTAKVDVTLSAVSTACVSFCSDDFAIGSASVEKPIGAASTPLDFQVPVDPNVKNVPAQKFLRLLVNVKTNDPRHVASSFGFAYHAAGGRLELPLVEDPTAPDLLSHLRFYVTENQEFVNPGRTRMFHVRLANEGAANDTVELRTNASAGWQADVQPARRFTLQPGESVNLGVYLRAPDEAPEGTTGMATLNATSVARPMIGSVLRLQAVTTRGVDIPDQSSPFLADEDTQRRIAAVEAKKSPGAPLLLILAAVATIVAGRRRA